MKRVFAEHTSVRPVLNSWYNAKCNQLIKYTIWHKCGLRRVIRKWDAAYIFPNHRIIVQSRTVCTCLDVSRVVRAITWVPACCFFYFPHIHNTSCFATCRFCPFPFQWWQWYQALPKSRCVLRRIIISVSSFCFEKDYFWAWTKHTGCEGHNNKRVCIKLIRKHLFFLPETAFSIITYLAHVASAFVTVTVGSLDKIN